ncbi:PIN domain-containing protein [Acidobacteria bacterium AB60]|nr:PIN domain-containing protein [Acidobacteria bacterium AB60]
MTLFFPDLNVWLALSVRGHSQNALAWAWISGLSEDTRLIFSRYTQLGLLRLLTNNTVMGDQTLKLGGAWEVYDRWLEDPRVEFYPEPREAESAYRHATKPFAAKTASQWVGDCWLLAFAASARANLVTFDRALHEFARKQGHSAIIPA